MANPWLSHVKKTMKQMKHSGTYKKGDGLKKVIMAAKKTYKKRGGADGSASAPETPVAPMSVTGGRRRKTRRSRR
jgi:hypothetical protein